MKRIIHYVLLILVFCFGCKSDDDGSLIDCSLVDCGLPFFELSITAADTGEDVFLNGLFDINALTIVNVDQNVTVPFNVALDADGDNIPDLDEEALNELEQLVFFVFPIGEDGENNYLFRLSETITFTLTFTAEFIAANPEEGNCCGGLIIEGLSVEGASFEQSSVFNLSFFI